MSLFLDRLNAVRRGYANGLLPSLRPHEIVGKCHELLDELDKCAGIATAWRDGHVCNNDSEHWWCDGDHNKGNYVGARLALHEQHLALKRAA